MLVPSRIRWQGKREDIKSELWCVCIQSLHTKLHGPGKASKSFVGCLLHLRHYGSQQVDHRVPLKGLRGRHTPKQHRTALIHTRYPAGARLTEVKN